MSCPGCGFENPQGMRFCGKCGASLASGCPDCGFENPEGFAFCGKCGAALATPPARATAPPRRDPRDYTPRHLAEKILTQRSALEGERKQVTVLFADVKSSTELSEGLDPEEWHGILERFFQILADGVHRFEGTVNQYTGDGIMALFGAPLALEDHAQRACFAALSIGDALRDYAEELKRERGLAFSVRMGLNSGEVVVGRIGDDLRMDYTAQGHTVALAARMQELADPGSAYLTEDTARLVAGYFDLRDLGAFRIKGASGPVGVRVLEGAGRMRTRLDVSRARGLSRFVGRTAEAAALEEALARCGERDTRVVGIVGEAGVGKSRLCFELLERCAARGIPILTTRGVAHGRNVPLLPMLELFRAYYGIDERDTEERAREKIAGRLLLIDESLRDVLPYVFDLLGVADPQRPTRSIDPEARNRLLHGLMRQLVRGRGERQSVTLIEDLHWLDDASDAYVATLVEAVEGTRGLLVLNFRPEYHAEWMQRSTYQQLPLAPLGTDSALELLEHLLGRDPSLGDLPRRIAEDTGGNPFFVEEVVLELAESGALAGERGDHRLVRPVETLAIPTRVQPLLAARIDRLPEDQKSLLQTASVIGKSFAEPLLEAVSEQGGEVIATVLAALRRAEFVYEESLYPESIHAFKHPLTQEVAYQSMLGERRARVHAAVARAIESRDGEPLDERAALLASHWEQAGEELAAARWHRRAAEWAGVGELAESSHHWARVWEIARALPESEETVGLCYAAALQISNYAWRGALRVDPRRVFEEARELGERQRNDGFLAMLHMVTAAGVGQTGDLRGYVALADEALAIARRTGSEDLVRMAQLARSFAALFQGRLATAHAIFEAEIGLGGGAAADFLSLGPAFFHGYRAMLLINLGHFEEGERELRTGIDLARELGDIDELAMFQYYSVVLKEVRGDLDGIVEAAHQAVALGERGGGPYSRFWSYDALALAKRQLRDWSGVAEAAQTALEVAERYRTAQPSLMFPLVLLAQAALELGEPERARRLAEETVERADAMGVESPLALRVAASILIRTEGAGAADRAGELLDRAWRYAQEWPSQQPDIELERAELARVLGDEAGWRRCIRAAHRLHAERGAHPHAARLVETYPDAFGDQAAARSS